MEKATIRNALNYSVLYVEKIVQKNIIKLTTIK